MVERFYKMAEIVEHICRATFSPYLRHAEISLVKKSVTLVYNDAALIVFRARSFMREQTERWMKLCEQASTEQDPKKLLELVKKINDVLEKKKDRLAKEGSKE